MYLLKLFYKYASIWNWNMEAFYGILILLEKKKRTWKRGRDVPHFYQRSVIVILIAKNKTFPNRLFWRLPTLNNNDDVADCGD